MTIGIIGLGLIGGSLAKAVKENTNHKILVFDKDQSAMLQAKLEKVYDGVLSPERLCECDIVLIALYPKAAIDYISKNAENFKKDCIVTDCAGVKRNICEQAEVIANANNFRFIGGHPMAGTQFSGFKYSRGSLFKNAPMILTPRADEGIKVLERAKNFFMEIGFGSVVFTTPEIHDKKIAYTSQLAHVVSNAYVKSPEAAERKGFSAGSYKDLTRVARLNEEMWTELFLENGDNLANEIDILIQNLTQYKNAIEENDRERLKGLLRDGRTMYN